MADITRDTASLSNPFDVASEHATFTWNVDFQRKVIHGSVKHIFVIKKAGTKEAMCAFQLDLLVDVLTKIHRLDTWDLEISKIEVNGHAGKVSPS